MSTVTWRGASTTFTDSQARLWFCLVRRVSEARSPSIRDDHPTNWREWEGFNHDALTQTFGPQLSQEYRGEQQPRPLLKDLCIFSEDTLEDLLRRFVTPVVNYALED